MNFICESKDKNCHDIIRAEVIELTPSVSPANIYKVENIVGIPNVQNPEISHREYKEVSMRVPRAKDENFKDYICQVLKCSPAQRVKMFTEESTGRRCPNQPAEFNLAEITFLFRMILSEMAEMANTVCETPEASLQLLHNCIGVDTKINYRAPTDTAALIGEQADAVGDLIYYALNACAKKGINLDGIFGKIHGANMNKRFEDGKFHRRDDGKVIKPPEWVEPDITAEIRRQMKEGSWGI